MKIIEPEHIHGEQASKALLHKHQASINRSMACLLLWITDDGSVAYSTNARASELAWLSAAAQRLLMDKMLDTEIDEDEPAS